ncbi:hypothetical protein Tco_0759417 [Tanacetum coccineum]
MLAGLEGYRNTIKLSVGNNVVSLQSDTIRLVQNGWKDLKMQFSNSERKSTIGWLKCSDFLRSSQPAGLPKKIDTEMPVKEAEKENEAENGTKNEPIKKAKNKETAEAPNSQPGSINVIAIHPKQQSESHNDKPEENEEEEKDNPVNIHVCQTLVHPGDPVHQLHSLLKSPQKLNSLLRIRRLVPQASKQPNLDCTKGDDGDVMFIKIVKTNDDPHKEEPEVREQEVEYFDILPTRNESAYHKYLIVVGQVPCYISKETDLHGSSENSDRGVSNFTRRIKGMHVFVGNFTYVIDFMIVEDISSIIDPRLSQVVLGRPFVEISNMTHDPPEGVVRFTNGTDEVAYKMPHKIEQYNSLSDLEKEHTKSVYLRNDEDRRRGVEYVMSKILGFYKECLELGPEYVTGMDDEGEVT